MRVSKVICLLTHLDPGQTMIFKEVCSSGALKSWDSFSFSSLPILNRTPPISARDGSLKYC